MLTNEQFYSLLKRIATIVACQLLLLIFAIPLLADMGDSKFENIKKFLSLLPAETKNSVDFQIASSFFNRQSSSVRLLTLGILITSLVVIILSFSIAIRLWSENKKAQKQIKVSP